MEKRWRALPKFVSIDFNDVDHADDPSNDDEISDTDDDEKRWCALLGLVTDDSNWLLFLILTMPMIQVILVTVKLMMMQIILIIF